MHMSLYIMRVGMSKGFYQEITHIFAIGHYKPKELGEDDFSRKLIYFYKYGNDINFFLEELTELYKLRFEGDSMKFDYFTLYPTRKKDGVNPNMVDLVNKISANVGLPYKQVLRRNKDVKPNHELKTFNERVENVKGSVDVTEDVVGKNILVLDNTATTGISLIDVANLLLSKGAKNVACICLGLSCKEKDTDYNDLNQTLKYSKISKIFKSPYVPKEKREKWKKEH